MSTLEPGEPADEHTAEPGQRPHHPQVGQHAVDPVQVLAHVLEEEEGTVEIGKVGRADQALEQGEVAAGKRAVRDPAAHGDDPVLLRDQYVRRRRQRLQQARRLGRGEHPREMPAAEPRHRGAGGGRVEGDDARRGGSTAASSAVMSE